MIVHYTFGNPYPTKALTESVQQSTELPDFLQITEHEDGICIAYPLLDEDAVFGLGESLRGINKRGWQYIQNNTDHGDHTEDARFLYSAHNFIVVAAKTPFGLFVDCPASNVEFDIGYTHPDLLSISAPKDLSLVVITGKSIKEIVKQFRQIIGPSYIPPKFGFGYAQSRFEYKDEESIQQIADRFDALQIPLDMINLDLDYMQDYKDFTLNEEHFAKNFTQFCQSMQKRGIHLVPIIDAAIRQEEGYDVYDSGHALDCFVKREDGSEFVGAVWPGECVYPDFLNEKSRKWFGSQYKLLTDAGIDAFWNDMNEPAIFYTPQGRKAFQTWAEDFFASGKGGIHAFEFLWKAHAMQSNPEDYASFYHETPIGKIRHDKVHNLYGMYMTMASAQGLEALRRKRTLLFSRSSYIGAHRYGGLWTGDNSSWWSHLQLIFHQLPGLNMAGFLYSGCDLGGFACDCTRDLMVRFLQLGVFMPLMRNHSAKGGRKQEPYQFDHPEDLGFLITMRYRLIPYLYSEFLKAVHENTLLFTPLCFEYEQDDYARQIEDELLFGHELLLAPVLEQNKTGRMVYLPEEMMKISCSARSMETEILEKGWHWTDYPQNALVFFIRKDKAIPLASPALRTSQIQTDSLKLIGYDRSDYELWDDDGISLDAKIEKKILN